MPRKNKDKKKRQKRKNPQQANRELSVNQSEIKYEELLTRRRYTGCGGGRRVTYVEPPD